MTQNCHMANRRNPMPTAAEARALMQSLWLGPDDIQFNPAELQAASKRRGNTDAIEEEIMLELSPPRRRPKVVRDDP